MRGDGNPQSLKKRHVLADQSERPEKGGGSCISSKKPKEEGSSAPIVID